MPCAMTWRFDACACRWCGRSGLGHMAGRTRLSTHSAVGGNDPGSDAVWAAIRQLQSGSGGILARGSPSGVAIRPRTTAPRPPPAGGSRHSTGRRLDGPKAAGKPCPPAEIARPHPPAAPAAGAAKRGASCRNSSLANCPAPTAGRRPGLGRPGSLPARPPRPNGEPARGKHGRHWRSGVQRGVDQDHGQAVRDHLAVRVDLCGFQNGQGH